MKEGLGTMLAIGGFAIFAGCVTFLANWMLEPINRVAGVLRATTRFMLTDVIALMILLQVGLGVSGQALSGVETSRESIAMYWLLVALLAILFTVLWAAGVCTVSRAGITNWLRRIAVMVVLIPTTLAVMVTLPGLIVFLGIQGGRLVFDPTRSEFSGLALLAMALACLALAAAAMRWLSYWALAGPAHRRLPLSPPSGIRLDQ